VTLKSQPEGIIFGQRLRELRTAPRSIADRSRRPLRIESPFISELERGVKVPSLTMILRLAQALECRVYELVSVFDEHRETRPSPDAVLVDRASILRTGGAREDGGGEPARQQRHPVSRCKEWAAYLSPFFCCKRASSS